MIHETAQRRSTFGLVLVLVIAGVSSLHAQDPRDALVTRAFNEFDAARRLQLLMGALNPTAGPPRGTWPVAVQLLAQTLIEDGQDSIAGVWLRWALRLSPDLQHDTVQFLPKVVVAYRSARDFVLSTRSPGDSTAATTWLWPAQETGERVGRIQVAAAALAVPVRIEVKGVGPIGVGGSIPLSPGSYQVSASSSAYDSMQVTREVLPGVTTVLEFRPPSALVRLTDKQQPDQHTVRLQQPAEPRRKGGLPWWVKVGAGGGVVWAILWNAWIKHAHM